MSINEQNFRWKMKVQALTLGVPWTPRAGDHFTMRDAALTLYRIGGLSEPACCVFDPTATEAAEQDHAHAATVWVPDFILGTGEKDRPRIAAEAFAVDEPHAVSPDLGAVLDEVEPEVTEP